MKRRISTIRCSIKKNLNPNRPVNCKETPENEEENIDDLLFDQENLNPNRPVNCKETPENFTIGKNRKQVIGCHVTGSSIHPKYFKKFMQECLDFSTDCGLNIVGLASDMGNENRALWKEFDVHIPKYGVRSTSFCYRGHMIHVLPDINHIIKNLKSCVLNPKTPITLFQEYCTAHSLSSNVVMGKYVIELWNYETTSNKELRLPFHYRRTHFWVAIVFTHRPPSYFWVGR